MCVVSVGVCVVCVRLNASPAPEISEILSADPARPDHVAVVASVVVRVQHHTHACQQGKGACVDVCAVLFKARRYVRCDRVRQY